MLLYLVDVSDYYRKAYINKADLVYWRILYSNCNVLKSKSIIKANYLKHQYTEICKDDNVILCQTILLKKYRLFFQNWIFDLDLGLDVSNMDCLYQ